VIGLHVRKYGPRDSDGARSSSQQGVHEDKYIKYVKIVEKS
jgi:hypothetical protein